MNSDVNTPPIPPSPMPQPVSPHSSPVPPQNLPLKNNRSWLLIAVVIVMLIILCTMVGYRFIAKDQSLVTNPTTPPTVLPTQAAQVSTTPTTSPSTIDPHLLDDYLQRAKINFVENPDTRLNIEFDKPNAKYNVGETIQVRAKNASTAAITIYGFSFWVFTQSKWIGISREGACGAPATIASIPQIVIKPGETKTFSWNQQATACIDDKSYQQIMPRGQYKAVVGLYDDVSKYTRRVYTSQYEVQ